MVNLSGHQNEALQKIMAWYRDPSSKHLCLGGYAGTGKSTLAKFIAEEIGEHKVCSLAFTGKAANVLREKGFAEATTIHSGIYKPYEDDDGAMKFMLNWDSELREKKLIIVDEYSMVSKEIVDDMFKLFKKVLFLGDPFQLPPVNGNCPISPDLFLTEVHRQALDSGIIRAATHVREGGKLEFCDWGDFRYRPRQDVAPEEFLRADQIICGFNKTRTAWNKRYRDRIGKRSTFPLKGDKLICLRNNHKAGVFNGMIDYAARDSDVWDDDEDIIAVNFGEFPALKSWAGSFLGEPEPWEKRLKFLDRFDFGYVITCHKSQGSEFDNVILYREPIGKDKTERNRWQYTGITRASKKLDMVEPQK